MIPESCNIESSVALIYGPGSHSLWLATLVRCDVGQHHVPRSNKGRHCIPSLNTELIFIAVDRT